MLWGFPETMIFGIAQIGIISKTPNLNMPNFARILEWGSKLPAWYIENSWVFHRSQIAWKAFSGSPNSRAKACWFAIYQHQ
jgi:hypothetical protein